MYRIALVGFALYITGCEEDQASSVFDTGMEEALRASSPMADPIPSTLEVYDEFVCFEDDDSDGYGSDIEEIGRCYCPIPDKHHAVTDMCGYCNIFNCTKTKCSYRPDGGGTVQTVKCKL